MKTAGLNTLPGRVLARGPYVRHTLLDKHYSVQSTIRFMYMRNGPAKTAFC